MSKPTAAPSASTRPAPAPKPRGTVIVASKLPMAIELTLCEMRSVERRLRETRWTESEAVRIGNPVRVNGTAYPRGPELPNFRPRPQIEHGYALTFNVDRDFWVKWLEQNETTEMVVNNVIFAGETIDEVRDRARKEFLKINSGLEPITPPREGPGGATIIEDHRLPRPISGISMSGSPGPTDADAA